MRQPFFDTSQIEMFGRVRFNYLTVDEKDFVLTITLNRPEKRNAFHPQMVDEIAFALARAGLDKSIRCLVIKANGPVFCAGADLNSFLEEQESLPRSIPSPTRTVNLGEAFAMLDKPSIAQIEGPVLAGGFLILAGVTFAYATEDAYFSLPEVKRGIWPMQVMASLATLLPARKIMEMCITGKRYTAADTLSMGLLTQVCAKDRIQPEVNQLASSVAENAPLAISSGMRAFRQHISNRSTLESYSALQKELGLLLQSEDASEGIQAFREKRTPKWKNQ